MAFNKQSKEKVKRKSTQQNNATEAGQDFVIEPNIYQIEQYQGRTFIEKMAFMLIRPPRFSYNRQLTKPVGNLSRFTQLNFEIPFELTLYKQQQMEYVILYLHGNSSCKLQGFMLLSQLPEKVGLACFDFEATGLRKEKQYITLGKDERQDVDIAAKFLKTMGYNVVGWGRSMGAASLLLSQELSIVLSDSSYSSLSVLCKQSANKVVPCYMKPFKFCLFDTIYGKIRNMIIERTGMDLEQMDIAKALKEETSQRKILFIHGESDTLINVGHVQRLFQSYEGSKQILTFEGTHNSTRPQQIVDKVIQFFKDSLEIQELAILEKKSKMKFSQSQSTPKTRSVYDLSLDSLKKRKR